MAAKKHGLGRGLDALIQRSIPEQKPEEEKNDAAESVTNISFIKYREYYQKNVRLTANTNMYITYTQCYQSMHFIINN